ncbi:ArsR family transcriptional regulator [Candidatus Hydrogenisulfobacillus filiaventi]|uniref:ArsR family transcriptional regulator n=1 Tax=Candidatus Hydrogenisulfobacillus filiaventi TaxID=2707344 RepID=A0A6F8ZDF6_9FIRM|nr:ArsR family transcriptional regulator [Candidatus Hydrogenisulfobacillus filiaventi]
MFRREADLFRALGDPVRLHILALLRVREACVCELTRLLPVSQPAVSQHLRKLRAAGLVEERRHRYWTYYRLPSDPPPLALPVLEHLEAPAEEVAWLKTHRVASSCTLSPGTGAAPARFPLPPTP